MMTLTMVVRRRMIMKRDTGVQRSKEMGQRGLSDDVVWNV
jgi:hypothetical protein